MTVKFKAKIRRDAPVYHDHGCCRWPKLRGFAVLNPDMEFDCEQKGDTFWLAAHGYGDLDGGQGAYGNGSIGVRGVENLILSDKDRARVIADLKGQKQKQINAKVVELAALCKEFDAIDAPPAGERDG